MPEPLFNKAAGHYPATSLKERTPTQVFSDEFYEILKTTFLQNTSRRLLLFYGKIFYQENRKEPSGKRRKMETGFKKNNDTRRTKA